MLSAAILAVADRLITTLMTLVDAVTTIATADSTPSLPTDAAQNFALRLIKFVTTLIDISAVGVRPPPEPPGPADIPADTPAAPPTPRAPPGAILGLPRHRGWLLAALPDIAPAVAADLVDILADPAFTELLAAAPTLNRTLRQVLSGLGLAAPKPPPVSPQPVPPPPVIPPPAAAPSRAAHPSPAGRIPAVPPAAPKSARRDTAFPRPIRSVYATKSAAPPNSSCRPTTSPRPSP